MKRLWFAAVFIAVCVLTCAYEKYVVKSAYEDIVSVIDIATETESADEKVEYCREIAEKWEFYYKKISLITDHSILEDADISIASLKALAKSDQDGLDDILIETKSELEHIYESSKINLSNIL